MNDGSAHRERVSAIVAAALHYDAGDRIEYVRAACSGDESLWREVAETLARHAQVTGSVPTAEDRAGRASSGTITQPSEQRFAPGEVLDGRYRIVSLIGRGGMGDVYRADDLRLAQPVALKFLAARRSRDPDRLQRFFGEVRLARQVSHPNVCRVHDVADADGVYFISMEYVDGEDLASLMSRVGRLRPDTALSITRDLCAGLGAAHSLGIVHRDLKPANILIDRQGGARIADFGIADLLENLAGGADLAGTPSYMAPEQLTSGPISARTDLYALGLIVYEMFTGKPRFHARSVTEALGQHAIASHDDLRPEVAPFDPSVQRLIVACLEERPDARPASVESLQALAAHPLDARRHNLPGELTSFVGRRTDLLELSGVLASARLLSLTGAGGIGKTRMALRLARDVVNRFADGVWLVDLAPLARPDLVAQTIATALGIREGPQRPVRDVLLDTLQDRELLLVLDTCEHLITACAELVEALLHRAPALRILATSREALGVSGETVYRVGSLPMPGGPAPASIDALIDSEAGQLFIERASTADPSFSATPENADAIARLCRRLDGIPLAIELAAARVVVLSPAQIEARLQDRFRLLTGGARTAVARQRTLEAAVDWSYQLLSDVERLFLNRLSVFPATWSLEAAEHICRGDGIDEREVLDLVSGLVRKSLVVVDSQSGAARRYRLLETVRQYARQRLVQTDAADQWHGQHVEYFVDEFREASSILCHHDQLPCLRRLQMEQENVRAALDWALKSPALAEKGVELAAAVFWFWIRRGLFEEGKLWLEQALAAATHTSRSLRAQVLIGIAHMYYFQGHSFEAVIDEALSLGRADNDPWIVSHALFVRGLSALHCGDNERALACAVEAREAANASGDTLQHGAPLVILAGIAASSGDLDRAQSLYDESIDVHRRAGDVWGLGMVLLFAAGLRIVRQDFEQARAQASEALSLCQEIEDPRGIAWSLAVFASLVAAAGDADRAARLWGFSDRLLDSVGGLWTPETSWIRGRHFESVKSSLGVGPFETARAEGRTMSLTQAIALARQRASALENS